MPEFYQSGTARRSRAGRGDEIPSPLAYNARQPGFPGKRDVSRRRRHFPASPAHPRNWGQCLTLALTWLAACLPWRAALRLGMALGRVAYHLAPGRRAIARRNLELCFPDMDPGQREALIRENFAHTGKGVIEIALGWYGGAAVDAIPVTLEGLEHFEAARRDGRAVILLSGHFTPVELAARLLGSRLRVAAIYKPLRKKPVLDAAMLRARRRNVGAAYARDDIRGIVRSLRNGIPVWYAGDQDYGRRHSVFAPFFGQPAATITALSRLARMSNARVVPLFFSSRPDLDGYEITFHPALEDFPGGDDVRDATRMNQVVEAAVRRHPEQYLWIHRRFKRQPERRTNLYDRTGA